MRERATLALQHVWPDGPYPTCDAFIIFVGADESKTAGFRCDVVMVSGTAIATIVRKGVPRWRHAPISIDEDDNVLAIVRQVFATGLPQGRAKVLYGARSPVNIALQA